MRRVSLLAGLGLLLAAPTGQAMPVNPDARVQLEQPSGAEFPVRAFGDEWYHGYETLEGYTVVRDADGAWVYARSTAGGDLVPSAVRPSASPPAGTEPHERDEDRVELAESLSARAVSGPEAQGSPAPLNEGAQSSLVILAQYSNQASLGTTPAEWSSRFFGLADSVSDYYDEVSYGELQIDPAAESHGVSGDGVVGWVTVNTNHPNVRDTATQAFASQQAARDAINAADPWVDFSSYDLDSNGSVEAHELHITVIPAGYEASDNICRQNAAANQVWGHKAWTIPFVTTPVVDGVWAGGDYTMFGEKHCAGGERLATLGIMVHEIGHDLDMPDLYDTDKVGPSSGGVGHWSVMGHGSWLALPNSAPGTHPPHLDAYLKSFQGWLTPTAITGPRRVTLTQAETSASAVRVGAPGASEYFLVENRQKHGYDQALPGCGLVVWHVDETQSGNADDARRLIDLEEADNHADHPYDAGDAFRLTPFTEATSPGSNLNDGSASHVRMRHPDGSCSPAMSAHFSRGAGQPSNDDFSARTVISGDVVNRVSDSNAGASTENGEPLFATGGGASVWYRWTASASAPTTITTAGSAFNTVLGVFQGSTLAGLTPLASNNDDPSGGQQSRVTFNAVQGTRYYVAVDGHNAGSGAAEGPVQLHLTHFDTPPVAVADATAFAEDAPATAIDVLGNDTDSTPGPISIRGATDPAHGTTVVTGGGAGLTYQPDANFCGQDTFSYSLNGGSSALVTVSVSCVDDPSSAAADLRTVQEDAAGTDLTVLVNDFDVDNLPVITAHSDPAHGAASHTSSAVYYQPEPDFCGDDSLTYTLAGGSSAAVSVTVACVDDRPEPGADELVVTEDDPPTLLAVLDNDRDIDGGPMSIAGISDPPRGAAAADPGGLTYRPDADFCGSDSFTYSLNGGATGPVNVTVVCVDDAPRAAADAFHVALDSPGQTLHVLSNDSDVDAGPKFIDSVSTPPHGVVGLLPGGLGLTYRPAAGYCGTDSMTYVLNGGARGAVSISIPCPDRAPPQTRIGSRPGKRTSSRSARFTFVSTETGSRFRCNLDAAGYRSCPSPKVFRGLKPGPHVLRVTATDRAGNEDPTPAVYRWRVTGR